MVARLIENYFLAAASNVCNNDSIFFETIGLGLPAEKMTGLDYCLNEPCMRHGTCINDHKHNTYTCACLPRYTGMCYLIEQAIIELLGGEDNLDLILSSKPFLGSFCSS